MIPFKRVLAVGAHPDDVEYSCLGLLVFLRELGANVDVFVAGSGSQFDVTSGIHRNDETLSALTPLGFNVNFSKDTDMNYLSLEREIRQLLIDERFDCVLVHDPRDTHQEHRLLYDVTISAIRRINLAVLRYRSVSSTSDFQANLFVDVSSYYLTKTIALTKHASQAKKSYMQASTIDAFHTYYHPGESPTKYFEQYFVEKMYF